MKKLSTLILGLLALLPAKADEGMWTLYNLPQAVYNQMKLTASACLTRTCIQARTPSRTRRCSSELLLGRSCVARRSRVHQPPLRLRGNPQHSTVEHDTCSTDFTPRVSRTSCLTRTFLSASWLSSRTLRRVCKPSASTACRPKSSRNSSTRSQP